MRIILTIVCICVALLFYLACWLYGVGIIIEKERTGSSIFVVIVLVFLAFLISFLVHWIAGEEK